MKRAWTDLTRATKRQEWERDRRHGKGTYWVKESGKLRKQYAGDWKGERGARVCVWAGRPRSSYDALLWSVLDDNN